MTLPGHLGSLDFGKWAYGLIAAFIGGGAGAFSGGLAAIIVDPTDFNIFTHKFWALVATTFVISGLTPFFAFLHQRPLPDVMTQVERTVQKTEVEGAPQKVVTTVKQTETTVAAAASVTSDNTKGV